MKVLFKNRKGMKREIGKSKDEKGCYKIISDFLKKHNFKSYYCIIHKIDDKTTIVDVGSHHEFFYLSEE
jgi:hypothetical protein